MCWREKKKLKASARRDEDRKMLSDEKCCERDLKRFFKF